MKNTEIRIGNYIKRKGLVVKVDEQTFWDIKNNPEEYSYIRLNNEWFKRFNFKEIEMFSRLRYERGHFTFLKFDSDKDNYDFYYSNSGISVIRYVHQLQNLYHALTLEEL